MILSEAGEMEISNVSLFLPGLVSAWQGRYLGTDSRRMRRCLPPGDRCVGMVSPLSALSAFLASCIQAGMLTVWKSRSYLKLSSTICTNSGW